MFKDNYVTFRTFLEQITGDLNAEKNYSREKREEVLRKASGAG